MTHPHAHKGMSTFVRSAVPLLIVKTAKAGRSAVMAPSSVAARAIAEEAQNPSFFFMTPLPRFVRA